MPCNGNFSTDEASWPYTKGIDHATTAGASGREQSANSNTNIDRQSIADGEYRVVKEPDAEAKDRTRSR